MITNNPAGRLYEILETAKNHSLSSTEKAYIIGGERKETLNDVLAVVFDIDKNDEEKIIIAYMKLFTHIEDVKVAMDKIESRSKENLKKTIGKLESKLVNMSLNDKSHILWEAITNEALTALDGVTLGLDAHYSYGTLEEENIHNFKEKINELLVELDSLEFDNDLKIFVKDSLGKVSLMLEEYKLYGIGEIRAAAESGYGRILLNSQLSSELPKNEKLNNVIKSVLSVLSNINTATTFVKNAIPIAGQIGDSLKNFLQ